MARSNSDGDFKERPAWLVPIAVFVVIALLCAFFLLYYLAPNPASFIEEHPSPSSRSELVHVKVDGLALAIPANYLVYASARRGGTHREITLYAELPDLRGYSDFAGSVFLGNSAQSPIVYMLIREVPFDVPELARLQRIYLHDVVDARGFQAPFGLIQYTFRDNSGYRGEDLFVGRIRQGVVVMHCARPSADVPSPNCLRDIPLAPGIALSYRFKRAHLSEWREIAQGVQRLADSFTAAK